MKIKILLRNIGTSSLEDYQVLVIYGLSSIIFSHYRT